MLRLSSLAAAATLLPLMLGSGPVNAFERQWHVGGAVGAGFFSDPETKAGPLVGLYGAYGLSDMFDAKLELNGATHGHTDGRVNLVSVSAGLAYKVDIIEWIPYFGAQVGYYYLSGDVLPGELGNHEVGLSLELGLDYALSRATAAGVGLRYHGFLHDPMSSLADAPYWGGLLRLEHRWGW
jgi:hypothetical protein